MKRLTRIFLTVIAVILTVSMITSCGLINIIANYVVSGLTQTGPVDFNSIEYTRPDFETIHAGFDTFLADLKAGKNAFTLQMSLSETYTLFNEAQSQYAIAQIVYYNIGEDAKTQHRHECTTGRKELAFVAAQQTHDRLT